MEVLVVVVGAVVVMAVVVVAVLIVVTTKSRPKTMATGPVLVTVPSDM